MIPTRGQLILPANIVPASQTSSPRFLTKCQSYKPFSLLLAWRLNKCSSLTSLFSLV